MQRKKVYSNVAIDLGGRYTGVVSYTSEGAPKAKELTAITYDMPINEVGLIYSQNTRTAVRHQRRNKDRFVFARRFIELFTKEVLGRALTPIELEAISSLMRRRGYNRVEVEIDLQFLVSLDVEPFSTLFPKLFKPGLSLLEQWEEESQDNEWVANFIEEIEKIDEKKLLEPYPELSVEKKAYKQALSCMRKAGIAILQQEVLGHKHRKTYLDNIRTDLKNDPRLKEVREQFGGTERLWRTIGNISNLQLRAFRWYFNDKAYLQKDSWDDERFKKVWLRAYQYFHYEKEDQTQSRTLLQQLHRELPASELLCVIDPRTTIPPYEDQNNRRPPVDQTLLLNPTSLDFKYPKWECWCVKFELKESALGADLDEILCYSDRKSVMQARRDKTIDSKFTEKLEHSYLLQRIFDRTMDQDPYQVRRLAYQDLKNVSQKWHKPMSALEMLVGSQHLEAFLTCAREYYEEVAKAQKGLWPLMDQPLLERSDLHPPMKAKILSQLVANVLCVRDLDFEKFKTLWNAKISGNSTLRSCCHAIETLRKLYGNTFQHEYQKACAKNLKTQGEVALNREEKELVKIRNLVDKATAVIKTKFELDEQTVSKFNNPYSMAQLYTLLETERQGFTKTTRAVHLENRWRMLGQGDAMCSRLPSDSQRPFDGALRRILNRQAYEIARNKYEELKKAGLTNADIKLNLLIESNQFEFSASIATLKKNANTKSVIQKAEKGKNLQEKRWENKNDRIKRASRDVCPYTGQILEGKGEIDHIISRSYTTANMGGIFNSEANLIYCSLEGNQKKGNVPYTLENLAPKYLQAVFGQSNVTLLKKMIEQTIEDVLRKNSRLIFELMTNEEQDAVRHGLFLPNTEIYNRLIRVLAQSNATRVNGTQKWFALEIFKSLKTMSAVWCQDNNNRIDFDLWGVQTKEVRQYRDALAKVRSELKKQTPQPIVSHAVDALCVLAAASADQKKTEAIGTSGKLADDKNIEELLNLLPENFSIFTVQSKSSLSKSDPGSKKLFKDGIYAEHFIPIMVFNGKLRIGFEWGTAEKASNSVEVIKGQETLLETLAPYFTTPYDASAKKGIKIYRIDSLKAFEHLHKVYAEECTDEEKYVADCLEGILYTTSNVNLSKIYDIHKKSFLNREDIIKKTNFKVKCSFPKGITTGTSTLILPAQKDWERVLDQLEDVLGTKCADGETRIQGLVSSQKSQALKHRKTKRINSLPQIAGPSGGVRIERQHHNGGKIFQLYDVNGAAYKGFSVDEKGQIDWKHKVYADSLKGRSITFVKGRYFEPKKIVPMDEWIEIIREDDLVVSMSPGTNGRRYVQIEQPKKNFLVWVGLDRNTSIFELDSVIKLESSVAKSFASDSKFKELLGKPRGGVTLLSLGERVKYTYIVVNSNAAMESAYQEAYKSQKL